MGDDLAAVLIDADRIQARLRELAAEIDRDYAGRELLLVGVLKGAVMVMADLARALHTSGRDGLDGGLVVRVRHPIQRCRADPEGPRRRPHRTGTCSWSRTSSTPGSPCSWLLRNLSSRGPASLEVCTLLRKPDAQRATRSPVKYVGFDIPAEFVVGYGLDYAEKYRSLPFVGSLARHVYRPGG